MAKVYQAPTTGAEASLVSAAPVASAVLGLLVVLG
jgi:hypothetical protein